MCLLLFKPKLISKRVVLLCVHCSLSLSLFLSFFLSFFVYLLNLLFEPYRLHLLLPRREIFERVRSFHSVERFAVQLVQVSQRVDVFLVILVHDILGNLVVPVRFLFNLQRFTENDFYRLALRQDASFAEKSSQNASTQRATVKRRRGDAD